MPEPAAPTLVGRHPYRLRTEYADDHSRVLVATDAAGSTVALASGGTSRDVDAPAAWELYSLHLLRSVRGSGLADDLLDAVCGAGPACLWVLEANARARAFYRRHGFVLDGAGRAHAGLGERELRMVRPPG